MKRFLIFILLTLSTGAFAQTQNPKKIAMAINYPDYSVKFEVLNKKTACIHTNTSRIYYWYAYNKIMQTQGGFDGKLLHGSYKSFYLSDNLKEKGSFKKGLKNGEWISWFENGQINEISHWKNGVLHGNHSIFLSDNSVQTKRYKNGKIVSERKLTAASFKTMYQEKIKPKLKRNKKEEKKTDAADSDKPKSAVKTEQVKPVVKEKTQQNNNATDNNKQAKNENKKPVKKKDKKSWKEKINSLFKKKEGDKQKKDKTKNGK